AHGRGWPGGRDSGTLARDRLRRRAPPAPDRSDPRGGTPPGPLKGARRAREPYLKGTPAAGSFRTEREPYDDSNDGPAHVARARRRRPRNRRRNPRRAASTEHRA